MTLNEISAQAYTFFFAGFETTSSTLSFLMYECALNLELQYKLQKSIDAVLDKYNGTLTYESIFEMDYLDRAISGTLRSFVYYLLHQLTYRNSQEVSDFTIFK